MKLFKCGHCGQPVYFENYFCVQCNSLLGFDPLQMEMISLQRPEDTSLLLYSEGSGKKYKYCLNHQYSVCNWLLPAESDLEFCIACNLNNTIPDLEKPGHKEKWARIEAAKH